MAFQGHRKVNKQDGTTEGSWLRFTCGHCGRAASGAVVADYSFNDEQGGVHRVSFLACPTCARGSVKNDNQMEPGVRFGPAIIGLPDDVKQVYREARECMGVSAYTAAELVCRKILMHVAVDKGADEGKTFAFYVDHLAAEGFVTPPMKPWVNLIRQHGNESTHELPATDRDRAEGTVMFTAELLRLVYEMDYLSKKYAPSSDAEGGKT